MLNESKIKDKSPAKILHDKEENFSFKEGYSMQSEKITESVKSFGGGSKFTFKADD